MGGGNQQGQAPRMVLIGPPGAGTWLQDCTDSADIIRPLLRYPLMTTHLLVPYANQHRFRHDPRHLMFHISLTPSADPLSSS